MRKSPRSQPTIDLKTSRSQSHKPVNEAVNQNLSRTGSEIQRAVAFDSVSLMRNSIQIFKEALPDTEPELIGGFFADLLDLWEAGQTLDKKLLKIKELRSPPDREQLRDFLIWISAIQIDMASYWIGELKRDLPKLLHALDRLENSIPSKRKHIPAKSESVRKRRTILRKGVTREQK
jgi:hypothetical protein